MIETRVNAIVDESARPQPVKTVIVGAGAVVREYQGPSALVAERLGALEVVGVVDRDPHQLEILQESFPTLLTSTDLSMAESAELALVATPPRTHLPLGAALVRDFNCHLLVEKPLASSASEARALVHAAAEGERVLAVGHFRRFLPALETIADYFASGALGAVERLTIQEGGLFRWPATAAFFDPSLAGGGVTLDIGVHVLELLVSWLGMPTVVDYADDAMGGLEINSEMLLRWPSGASAAIRLSWDVTLANRYVIDFEGGRITWRTGQSREVLLEVDGVEGVQVVHPQRRTGGSAEFSADSHGFGAAFTRQWCDVARAVRGLGAVRVNETAVTAVALVEEMYSRRRLMAAAYWSVDELQRAQKLADGVSR